MHLLKGKQGDILQLPGVMYLDCHTNLALLVRDLYNHVHDESHPLVAITRIARNVFAEYPPKQLCLHLVSVPCTRYAC